jgi:CDP-diacylglycerol--glycerol-3-phosphate 3-phosphatidyltransferase
VSRTIPSLISALRLPIAAAFFLVDGLLWRGILLLLGAVSDLLDGWVARRFSLESRTGALLDPIFDKLFVTIALAAFLSGPYLSWWEFLILIYRDLYVGLGYLVCKLRDVEFEFRSRPGGKAATVLQMVTLFVLLLAPERAGLFIVAVGVASAIAIVDYTAAAVADIQRRAKADSAFKGH